MVPSGKSPPWLACYIIDVDIRLEESKETINTSSRYMGQEVSNSVENSHKTEIFGGGDTSPYRIKSFELEMNELQRKNYDVAHKR